MTLFKRGLRCFAIFVACVIGLPLLCAVWFYATCPVYTFDEPKPFSGENFYNPYQHIEPDGWLKCNFHVHARIWGGLTKGENTPEEIVAAYRKLNYDVVTLSNYMDICTAHSDDPLYIPVYEHGYGIQKVHQLALGARKVMWRDYAFLQNLHHKQHIIDLLKNNSRLVALCHPRIRGGYTSNDLQYLSGYDLIEVLNGRRIYEKEWDAALSNGHKVWLIANDDAHSVNCPGRLQQSATFVNVSVSSGEAVLERLAQGTAFGVLFSERENILQMGADWTFPTADDVSPSRSLWQRLAANGARIRAMFTKRDTLHPTMQYAAYQEKIQEAEKISFPIAIRVCEEGLHVVWQQRMRQIDFIGDHGRLLKTLTDTDVAFYPIRPEDTYVRVRLICPEGLVYFLNPIIRYEGDKPVRQTLHRVDVPRTVLKRVLIIVLLSGAFIGGIIIYVRIRRRHFFPESARSIL